MFIAGAFVGYIAMGVLPDRLGRKATIWLYYLGSLVLSLCLFLPVTERPALLILAAASGFFTSGQRDASGFDGNGGVDFEIRCLH
jgi:hypothetical protein